MRIAITIWGNRISPVFDSANKLMMADVRDSKITNKIIEEFNPKVSSQIISILKENQTGILICGAITDIQSKRIEQSGIQLISFITGNADKVLKAYIADQHLILDFLMPGTIVDSTSSYNF